MILFSHDWVTKHPEASYHINTSNQSWVEISKLYNHMGIKNHLFPLALHDTTLMNVDPFDPNISEENQFRIAVECKVNPWYFFREIARIPGGSGQGAVPLQANRGNIAAWWLFFCHCTTFLIQPRQTGKSVSVDELASYLLNVRLVDTDINLMTKDETLRANNIKRLKEIIEELPFYLKQRTKKDSNNSEYITIKALNNRYLAHVPQGSEKGALNSGRGLTSAIFLNDEGPFQPFADVAIPAAFTATAAARLRAQAVDEPYGNILTTTSGRKDSREGKFYYQMLKESAEWSEAFLDCRDQEHLEEVVKKASRSVARAYGYGNDWTEKDGKFQVEVTMNHLQLGKTDKWLFETIQSIPGLGQDKEAVDRDFFNRWTAGGISSPLSVETAERIKASQAEPVFTQIDPKYGYTTKWFVPEKAIKSQMDSQKHIFSMDTSNASGGDDISMRITEVTTGRVIAVGTYNETNLIRFSNWVTDWFLKYSNMVGIIENRSSGQTIIDNLLLILPNHGIDPFKVLFNRIVNEHVIHREKYDEICEPMGRRNPDVYEKYKKYFGFATSGNGITSRTKLYSETLYSAADMVGDVVGDKKTIEQILALEMKNGRIDHPEGEHDDLCFVGNTLVRTNKGNIPIKNIQLGDLILTREGYKPVIKLFKSKKEVISRFGLTGTANHPFITPTGEVQFADLKPDSKVYVWNEKLSNIEVRSIIDTLSPKGLSIEITSTDTTSGRKAHKHCIVKSTKTTLARFQKAWTSITRMKITSTTIQATLSASHEQNIGACTQCLRKPSMGRESVESVTTSLSNGSKRILNLLKNTQFATARKAREFPIGEKTILNLPNKSMLKLDEKVLKPAESEKQWVYNIMVEDCHEYFVNDILVHNCIAWLLGHWLLTNGMNLAHYGIPVSSILTEAKKKKMVRASAGSQEDALAEYNNEILEEIKKLTEQLEDEDDEMLSERLERRINYLLSTSEINEQEIFSIEELIHKNKDEKKKRIAEQRKRSGTNDMFASNMSTYQQNNVFRQPGSAWYDPTLVGFW